MYYFNFLRDINHEWVFVTNKRVAFSCVLIMSLFLNGCVDLAVNDHKNKHVDVKKISRVKGEVYTMRGGLGGIFSKGMNRLEDTLENEYHVYASSTVWFKGRSLSQDIIKNYKAHQEHAPIILVGHSLGANEQIQVASALDRAHIPVALLVTVDAVMPALIPPNVAAACNIYKSSFVPMFSGLVLKARDPKRTQVDNVNVESLKGADVNHFTIDGNEQVQHVMLTRVLRALHKEALR